MARGKPMKKSIRSLLVCVPALLLSGCNNEPADEASDRLAPKNEVSGEAWRSAVDEACAASNLFGERDSLFDFVLTEKNSYSFYDFVGTGETKQKVNTSLSNLESVEKFDAEKTLYSSATTFIDYDYDEDGAESITSRAMNDVIYDEGNKTYTVDKISETYSFEKDSTNSAAIMAANKIDNFLEDYVFFYVDLFGSYECSKYYNDSGVYTYTCQDGEGVDIFIQFTISNTSAKVLHESTTDVETGGNWGLIVSEIKKEDVNLAKPDLRDYELVRDYAPYSQEIAFDSFNVELVEFLSTYKEDLFVEPDILDHRVSLTLEYEDYEYTKNGTEKLAEKTTRTVTEYVFGYDNDTKCYFQNMKEFENEGTTPSSTQDWYDFYKDNKIHRYSCSGSRVGDYFVDDGTYTDFINYVMVMDGGFSDITLPIFIFTNYRGIETESYDEDEDIKCYADTDVLTMICKTEETDQIYQIDSRDGFNMKADVLTIEETDTTYKRHISSARFSLEIGDISVTLPDVSGLTPVD